MNGLIKKEYHGSYETNCWNFINNGRCPYCNTFASGKVHKLDSFAAYHIKNTDKDFLDKYWDYEKNTVSPWEISPSSNTVKIWIKCQNEDVNELNGMMKKDYHGSYKVSCNVFTRGSRCPYCTNRKNKVHVYDSFGYVNLSMVQTWDYSNNISPFSIPPRSSFKYNFICPECGEIFKIKIDKMNSRNTDLCSECSSSKGEVRIISFLRCNNVPHVSQKEYDGLVGLGGGNLSYDFYLPEYNLLIEYQGGQHEKYVPGFHKNKKYFERQVEHDRRKREYAEDNGIELLEIWYWDFDNIEEILNIKLKLNK